jgi:hypothetical protein
MSFIGVQMAKQLGMAGRVAEDLDKAVTIRPSSMAVLAVDSQDRTQFADDGSLLQTNGISTDFIITKLNSLFNGFFNRIAMNEIVLDWCIPNISDQTFNNTISITLGATTIISTIPNGHYTVANVLDQIVATLNQPGPFGFGAGTFRLEDQFGAAWVTGTSWGNVYLATTAGTNFTILDTKLAQQLSLQIGTPGNGFPVTCPNILGIRYIDFVSSQLTYNQDLKDNSTNRTARDVLYRWVLAYDNTPPLLDRYGYPIYQGYQSFIARRYLDYPKQIRWDPTMPIGQLSFQVFDDSGNLLVPANYQGELEYQMNLLLSEN